jgi:cell wall-associated NlpC family hydrolase
MPNFIRITMATATAFGALALAPTGAQAATTPTAAPAAVVPAAHLRLTKHQRKVRVEHRRQVRRNHEVAQALRVAARQQGDPYRYGATGPNAFDCSGLMLYSFRAAGLHLPRTAAAQAGAVRHIARSRMRVGDLVFFTSGSHVYHVGIFDGWSHGARIIIHAPYTGARVRKEAIWTNSWFAGTERLA